MKILRTIYAVIRFLLTIVLVALLAVVLTQRLSDNKMAIAGIRIFTVATESMKPKYLVGDALLIKSVEPEELQQGDDITYLGEKDSFKDRIVTHRIEKISKNKDGSYKIVTKGIANDKADPAINETQVYGKVIYKIKSISFINGIIGNLYGMYFVIVVPMAIMIFFEFINYKKDKKEDSEDEKTGEITDKKQKKLEKEKEKRKAKRNKRRERREKRRKKQE
ncbi:MAG: signal peptidase I [Clostridia bacterium]|nr:signal peptidase I [Clostridia bacterium]